MSHPDNSLERMLDEKESSKYSLESRLSRSQPDVTEEESKKGSPGPRAVWHASHHLRHALEPGFERTAKHGNILTLH